MLAGKRLLITGVMTRQSIAWAVAERAQRAGAEVVLTGFGRGRRLTERAARALPEPPDVLELDVNAPADIDAVGEELGRRWGALDGVLHAIAYAPPDALGGEFMATPADSASQAFVTSAYSFKALASGLRPLLAEARGSVVGLGFDASAAWPGYDWMGVAKAGLESVSRYLARDLGPEGIRVNLVSAGPLETPAASGIPGFDQLAGRWSEQAPLGWDTERPGRRGRRGLLPLLRLVHRHHRRDPPRGRRLPRDGRAAGGLVARHHRLKSEWPPQLPRLRGGRLQILALVGDGFPESHEVGVDRRQVGAVERVREPVTDPFQGRDIASHSVDVPGAGIDEDLARPQLEAAEVDLGGVAVAQLEVERRLRHVHRRHAGPGAVALRDRGAQVVERTVHLCREAGRHLLAPVRRPRARCCLGPGRRGLPVPGSGRVDRVTTGP